MLFKEALTHYFVSDHLAKRWGVQVVSLFGLDQLADQGRRCHNPAQAQARSQHFREGTQIDDIAVVGTLLTKRLSVARRCSSSIHRGSVVVRNSKERFIASARFRSSCERDKRG